MKRYAIGIDPGAHTGYAVYDRQDKYVLETATLDFWKVMDQMKGIQPETAIVVIEAPTGHVVHRRSEDETRGNARDKFASNVGSNRREAQLLADGIERLGFEVKRVRPTRTKWSAAQLERNTGIKKRTNEHVRDAIALVWGI